VFTSDLADSLDVLSEYLSALDCKEEASHAAEEAKALRLS